MKNLQELNNEIKRLGVIIIRKKEKNLELTESIRFKKNVVLVAITEELDTNGKKKYSNESIRTEELNNRLSKDVEYLKQIEDNKILLSEIDMSCVELEHLKGLFKILTLEKMIEHNITAI